MADGASGLAAVMPKVSGGEILNGIMWFLIAVIIVGTIAFITYYYMRKKKYGQYRVEIFDRDTNGNVYKTYDRAGIFLDKKTGYRLLFVEKAKVGMNPNSPPYVSHIDKKKRLIKTIYLRRIGVNNYVYIEVDLTGKPQFTMGEEDFNNAAQEMAKIRRSYDKKSWLDKYGALAAIMTISLIILIMMLSLFNKFGVLGEVSKNLLLVSENQERITELQYNMTVRTGTSISSEPITIITPGGT